jgi:hypothetical protein
MRQIVILELVDRLQVVELDVRFALPPERPKFHPITRTVGCCHVLRK